MTHCELRLKPLAFPTRLFSAFLMLLLSFPLYTDARDPIAQVPALRIGNADFVSLSDLARATGGYLYDAPTKHKIELRIGNHRCVFTRRSSLVAIDGEAHRLPLPTRYEAGVFYISADILPLLSRIAGLPLQASIAPIAPRPVIHKPEPSAPLPIPRPPMRDIGEKAANWTLKTVVIDPGHGGKDPGAIGPGGAYEKTIVLEVTKRLQKLLEKNLKVEVVLTRNTDEFVALRRRSHIALQQNGKIFVSLHCNASTNPEASGVEVYFLSEAKTQEAAEVARRENAALEYEKDDPHLPLNGIHEAYQGIALSLLSSQFLKESQDLAAAIHREFAQTISNVTLRGVKQANFFVMRYTMAQMPSVLVELGFISNRAEERRLRNAAHQQQLAEALYRGIANFKLRYEQQLSADR